MFNIIRVIICLFITEGSDIMSKKDNVRGYDDKKYINWEMET